MPRYTADYLYNEFKGLAGMRSDPQYANDDGYWVGGHCNWGGRHQLKVDCATIAREFEKLEKLDGEKIKAELNKCTSSNEYESKKRDYLRIINEVSPGLQARTGYSSSMFGICIIWSDCVMSSILENQLQDCRRDLENLKSKINGEKYQHVEELRILKLKEKQIRDKISELKRDANKEKNPTTKARILLMIEEEGKKLEANLKEQQTIPKSGINYNPSEHVSKLVEGIKKFLRDKGGRPGGNGGDGNPNLPNQPGSDPDNPFGDNNGGGGGNNDDKDPYKPPRGKKDEKQEKDNSQMIFIAIAVIVIFFLMSQKERPSREYEGFDYY